MQQNVSFGSRPRPRKHPMTLAIALSVGLLGGCAVVPLPLGEAEVADKAKDVLERVTLDQEPVRGPIDVYEAIARALKYNLDHRVEIAQAALRARELDLAHYSLLPNLVAGTGYAARSNDHASSSTNIFTGEQSLVTSTSQERKIHTADVAFAWNVLDFGLSYVRARQAADTYLIAQELRRKVVHRLVEDVRTAYWRAVSADHLISKLQGLESRVRRAQSNSRAISADRQASPITATTYERELVEIKRTIQELERELVVARTQLSSLMNLRPGTSFRLAQPARSTSPLSIRMKVPDMMWVALNNRAELREVWYRKRINAHEMDAALLELLPGLQLYAGTNFDSNDYLYNHNWLSWGAKATWNLLRVVQYPAKREVIEGQDALLDERSLAVTMAIMTQVHISRIRYHHFSRELATAVEYLDTQKRLVELMRAEAAADRISEQTLIREEMNTLVAEVKRDIVHAHLQNAFANVYASMGLDPYDGALETTESVSSLARRLRTVWAGRGDRGAGPRQRLSDAR